MRLILALLALFSASTRARGEERAARPVEVFFSPHGGCEAAVVRELANARTSVLVLAYSFTNAAIAKALVAAHARASRWRWCSTR